MCLTIPINALEIRFFFRLCTLLNECYCHWHLVYLRKDERSWTFTIIFYDIVISLHNYHYIYLFIIIVVPIASLIKKITCFIQCSINSNIEISSILFPASCVLTLFFNILHYIHSTWYIGLPGHKSISFITFSFLQKSWFMRNNENKHRCIFVQMGMYLI